MDVIGGIFVFPWLFPPEKLCNAPCTATWYCRVDVATRWEAAMILSTDHSRVQQSSCVRRRGRSPPEKIVQTYSVP